ncbi:hypothetical protein ACFXTO_025361 [Malus domestica]
MGISEGRCTRSMRHASFLLLTLGSSKNLNGNVTLSYPIERKHTSDRGGYLVDRLSFIVVNTCRSGLADTCREFQQHGESLISEILLANTCRRALVELWQMIFSKVCRSLSNLFAKEVDKSHPRSSKT